MASRSGQRPVKTKRTMQFNLPENVMSRIADRQAAHSERMDRAREEADSRNLMSIDARKKAMGVQDRISAPGYQKEAQVRKTNAYTKGLMDIKKSEQDYLTWTGRQTGGLPPAEEQAGIVQNPDGSYGMSDSVMKPPLSPEARLSRDQAMKSNHAKYFAEAMAPPITEEETSSAIDRLTLPGAGTRLGYFTGLQGMDRLLKGGMKGVNWLEQGISKNVGKAKDWLMQPY